MNNLKDLIDFHEINRDRYFIGISDHHSSLQELNKGIKESLYAVDTSEIHKKDLILFKDIGVYRILMPSIDNEWLRDFHDDIILPLKEYDDKYNTEIFKNCYKIC